MSLTKSLALAVLIPAGLALPAHAQFRGAAPAFSELDADASGAISAAEMEAFVEARLEDVRGRPQRDGRMGAIVDAADTDGDGDLTRAEVDAFVAQRTAQMVDRVFGRVDADGDGTLTAEEIAEARRGPRGMRIFALIDSDGDGEVSEAEYTGALARLRR